MMLNVISQGITTQECKETAKKYYFYLDFITSICFNNINTKLFGGAGKKEHFFIVQLIWFFSGISPV